MPWLDQLGNWIRSSLETLGYPGLASLVLLENLFPPIPSEIVLPLAGFFSSRGTFTLPGAVAAATLGSVAGALLLYGLGAFVGENRLRRFVRAYGRFFTVGERDLDRSLEWFRKYGNPVVFFAREVPLIRSLISIPAGFARMGLWRFSLFTLLGSLLWNSLLVGLGYVLGANWERVSDAVGRYQRATLVLITVAVLAFIGWRVYRARRRLGEKS